MKIYFRNPKTSAVRERVCDKENVSTVCKEEYIIGYTEIWKEIGADIEKIKLTDTAYFEGHMLFIKHNWSSTKNIEEFAPASDFTDFQTEKSTHILNCKFFSFPKSEVAGHKYAFVKAFEEYGNIKFEEIQQEIFVIEYFKNGSVDTDKMDKVYEIRRRFAGKTERPTKEFLINELGARKISASVYNNVAIGADGRKYEPCYTTEGGFTIWESKVPA